jgi:hypothetical protein
MRYFIYLEPSINDEPYEFIMSEQDIFDIYWPHWYSKMVKKYGNDHPLINFENCVQDWVTVNYAIQTEKPPTVE